MQTLVKQLKRALRYGSGEAFLILQSHPELPVDDLLLAAACHNFDYEPQCSGDRAAYIDELLRLRPNYRELIREIARRFDTEEQLADWDALQLYWLLCGSDDAEIIAIVHRRFVRKYRDESFFGFDAIAECEGLPGICFLAETIGATLLDDPFSYIPAYLDDPTRFPKERFDWRMELTARAEGNAAIRDFMARVTRNDMERSKPYTRTPRGMREITASFQQDTFCIGRRFQLSGAEVATLQQRFATETSVNRLATICKVLAEANAITASMFPRLARFSQASDQRLAEFATSALATLKDDQVRKFALEKFTHDKEAWLFITLLKLHWQDGDEKYIYPLFNRLRSPHARHWIILTLSRLKYRLPLNLLTYLYRRCTCGGCREHLVGQMLAQGPIPQALCTIMAHDSHQGVRSLCAFYTHFG